MKGGGAQKEQIKNTKFYVKTVNVVKLDSI